MSKKSEKERIKFSSKEIIIPTISLFIICLAVSLLLAFTDKITAPKIEKLAKENENKTMAQVLPMAKDFSDEKKVTVNDTEYSYYEGKSDGENIGLVVKTHAKSYNGELKAMVGIANDGKIVAVSITSIEDTAGLGMRAKEQSFLDQFKGKSGKVGVNKSGTSDTEIQAITGATITSRAMANAVSGATEVYEKLSKGEF